MWEYRAGVATSPEDAAACWDATCTLFGDILQAVRTGDLVGTGETVVLGSCITLTSVFARLVRLPFPLALGASRKAQGGARDEGAPP